MSAYSGFQLWCLSNLFQYLIVKIYLKSPHGRNNSIALTLCRLQEFFYCMWADALTFSSQDEFRCLIIFCFRQPHFLVSGYSRYEDIHLGSKEVVREVMALHFRSKIIKKWNINFSDRALRLTQLEPSAAAAALHASSMILPVDGTPATASADEAFGLATAAHSIYCL